MLRHPFIALLTALGISLSAFSAEVVVSDVTSRAIPINVSGYSGDAKSVLEFDLYVAGFDLVAAAQAQYSLNGKSGAGLEGVLADVNNKAMPWRMTWFRPSPVARESLEPSWFSRSRKTASARSMPATSMGPIRSN
jgi:hypothetical protein